MNEYPFLYGVTCIFIIRCYHWLVKNLITSVVTNLLDNYELMFKIVAITLLKPAVFYILYQLSNEVSISYLSLCNIYEEN